jgi:hypothetical protein
MKNHHRFVGLIICTLVALPAPSSAVTYVWQNICDESQINNSGVGDGSTDSTATGFAHFRAYDADPLDGTEGFDERIFWDITYDGLEGLLTKLHVHGPAMAGASNPGHIFDVFSDALDITAAGADLTSDRVKHSDSLFTIMLNSVGLTTGVPEDHLDFMLADLAYANIHTDLWPMGEIRCQLVLVDTILTDPQTKDQQKCTAALGKGLGKVAKAEDKLISKCIKQRTKGQVVDVETCILPDLKVIDVQAKTTADFTKRCTGVDKNGDPKLPTFGATDDTTVNAAAVTQSTDLTHAVFGADLNVSINDGADNAMASCQNALAKTVKKCQATTTKEYNRCVKGDLGGRVDLPIVDEFGFEHCMEVDRKGKIAKSCDATLGKIRQAIDKKCFTVDMAVAAAGCGLSDPADAAACMEASVRCQACVSGNTANAVSLDCDQHDDGASNLSCP